MTTTWNPLDKGSKCVLSGGNLTWAGIGMTASSPTLCRATDSHVIGKWYFEVKVNGRFFAGDSPIVGLCSLSVSYSHWPGKAAGDGWSIANRGVYAPLHLYTLDNGTDDIGTSGITSYYEAGDVLMIAVDLDVGKIWFGLNGTWLASGNPAAGTGARWSDVAGTLFPAVWGIAGSQNASSVTARFISTSTQYTIPSGFTAWGDSVAAPPPDPVPPDPGDGSDPGTPIDLWRVNPRVSAFTGLADQFTNDPNANRWDNVSPNLFFTPTTDDIQKTAFAITETESAKFVSRVAFGPGATVLPCDWFHRDDAKRVILVELDYMTQVGSASAAVPTKATRYFADKPFFDDENSRVYADCVKSVPRYKRSLNRATLRGRFTSSIGTLELDNADGAFDDLLTIPCDGSEIRFLIGDETWSRSEFIFVFSALVVKVTASGFDRISIALADTSLLLNTTIGGSVPVGGAGPSADKFRPFNFGIVRQVELIIQDDAKLIYVHSDSGDNTTVVDVRDRGSSVLFTDNGDGTVTLSSKLVGQGTCDLVIDNGYPDQDNGTLLSTFDSCRVSDAMYQLAGVQAGLLVLGKYGGASGNFDLLGPNDYHTGISVAQQSAMLDALDQLCDAGNCYTAVRRDGQFVFGWIRPEAIDFIISSAFPSIATITDDDLLDNGKALKIDHAPPLYYDIQGYANKNWTDQTDLDGQTLSGSDVGVYRRKGYAIPSDAGDQPDATTYLGPESTTSGYGVWLGGAPQLYHKTMARLADSETLISCRTDYDAGLELAAWQSIRRSQFLPWLEFIDLDADLCYFQAEIGNIIALDLSRFGFSGGKLVQVTDVDIGLTEGTVSLGLVRRRPAITDTYLA